MHNDDRGTCVATIDGFAGIWTFECFSKHLLNKTRWSAGTCFID